jgi:hypothetical protein
MNIFKRLWLETIWQKNAVPKDEWKFRSFKRVWLPLVDILYMLGGLSAVKYGVPAINNYFTDDIVDAFGFSMSITAFICLIGVSFVRLWWLEAAAKVVLFALMVSYITSLLMLTQQGQDSRGFVFVIASIAAVLLLVRLSIIGSEWADRRAKAALVLEGE